MQTTSREAYAVFGREVRVSYTGGEASTSLKIRRAGDTVVTQINGMSNVMIYDWNPNLSRFGWYTSGTTNNNMGAPVDIQGPAKSETWEWALGSFDQGVKGTFEVTVPDCVAHVTFGNGGASRQFKLDLLDIYIDGIEAHVQDPYGPPPPEGKELFLLLDNQTGAEQTVDWGGTKLTLKPGVNQIRYDGPVDANGLPTVGPSDFHGTIVSANGNTYLVSTLSPTGDDKIYNWIAPNNPSVGGGGSTGTTNPNADTVEIISKGDGVTRGDTIAIHHPGGGTTITTLPVSPRQTQSNTSGGGAVLSDPTKPKPDQTAGNTTTNSTTNNTTNNSTVNNHSTTIINNEGDNTDDGPPAGYTSPNLGNIETDAKNQADAIKGEIGVVTDKAGSFGNRLKFWSAPSESASRDLSWTKATMNIAGRSVTVEIEPRWISLIRDALLWIVKITFVYSVIKLFMK